MSVPSAWSGMFYEPRPLPADPRAATLRLLKAWVEASGRTDEEIGRLLDIWHVTVLSWRLGCPGATLPTLPQSIVLAALAGVDLLGQVAA